MRGKWITRIIGIILVSFFFLNLNGIIQYQKDVKRECLVVEKYQTAAGYKVSPKWILIIKILNDDNPDHKKAIDINVSPATYWECEKGKVYYIKLSESDINRKGHKDFIFTIALMSCVIGVLILLGSLFDWSDV